MMRTHFGELCAALLLAVVALTGMIGGTPPAYGWTDVLVRVDTVMPSTVWVGTGAPTTRIDNWNNGVQGTNAQILLSGRTVLCCVNTCTSTVYVGWSATVSTYAVVGATVAAMGEPVVANQKTCRAMDRGLSLYANSADAAGISRCALACEQLGKANP